MTHIFKANFWSTFSRVDRHEVQNPKISAYGLKATMSAPIVLHSSAADFDGIEGSDFVVTFTLTFEDELQIVDDAKKAALSQGKAFDIYTAVLDEGFGAKLSKDFSCVAPAIPGVSSHLTETKSPPEAVDEVSALGGFFHYGWIILLRLERDQMDLKLSGKGNDFFYSSEDIIRQRVRLINIKRRFLTHDRTNTPSLKKTCSEYREKFNMDKRFETLNTVHELFEHHLDNTSKVIQAKRTKNLSQALNLLTLLAIPLGIIGTILAIDLKGSFLSSPDSVATNAPLWFLVGGAFGLVFGLILLARLVDLFLNKQR